MSTPLQRQPGRRLLAAVAATGLLAAGGARASSDYLLSTRAYDTRGPQSVCLDVFCRNVIILPPQVVTDQRSGLLSTVGAPAADVWEEVAEARSSLAGADAAARAKLGMRHGSIVAGVAASAAMSSVFHSEASARLRLAYEVTVTIAPPAGWTGGLFLPACGLQCSLAIDFLHQTSGRFSQRDDAVPGAFASFSETLRIDGSTRIAGQAHFAPDPADSRRMALTATGDWDAGDVLPPQATDTTTTIGFNHLQLLPGLTTSFQLDTGSLVPEWTGRFRLELDQAAAAGFTNPAAYRTSPTGVSADFAHTSSFGLSRAVDPTGSTDLGDASVRLQFVALPAVPEPASALLLAMGGLALGWRARRHHA